MFISQQLKQSNIAEYLIYMWQVEDMIRANGLDIDKIKASIISQYRLSGEQEKELTRWYEDLIAMMRDENVAQGGHLQINNNIIINLTELHLKLLGSPKFPFYTGAYYKALPFIVELRSKKENSKDQPELETCFEALYGVMLLRLQKKEISKETTKAIEAISSLLGLLADYYHKEKKGELELDNE